MPRIIRAALSRGGPPLMALILLSACSHEPPRGFGRDNGSAHSVSEKAMIRALGEVDASEPQRLAVLAAFDRDDADRRRFAGESDELRRQIIVLSPVQPDYLARLEPLAQRKGQLVTEQTLIQARFEQAIATTLTPAQYEKWQAQMQVGPDGGRRGGGPRRRDTGGGMP